MDQSRTLLLVFPILADKLEFDDNSRYIPETYFRDIYGLGDRKVLALSKFVVSRIKKNLMTETIPRFYNKLVDKTTPNDPSFRNFCYAIDLLSQDHKYFTELSKRLNGITHLLQPHNDYVQDFNKMFRSALLSQLPVDFSQTVHAYFDFGFRVFSGTVSASEQDSEMPGELVAAAKDEFCPTCNWITCSCAEILKTFRETNLRLHRMNILDRLCGSVIAHLVEEKIESLTAEMCQGMLRSNSCLLDNWLEKVVLEWLRRIYLVDEDVAMESCQAEVPRIGQQERLSSLQRKLEHFLCETYARVLIDQFFNIIIEYPDSGPALDDLRECLKRVDMRQYLMATIKRCLEQRMLHPGVDTNDILTGYVATIKVLRHLDPSGVLLEAIIEPAKEYLRSRQDTVRCVITSLIEDTPSDLTEELARSEAVKPLGAIGTGTPADLLNWEAWEPDPVDAAPPKDNSKTDRSADIISMVVDIYGSKELFVKEYWNLLAKRLLLSLDLNTEKEIRNLELLKLRFGEAVLHRCEVMLKDISDSKRINAHVQCDQNYLERKSFDMSTLILSSQFWPAFNKETLELPAELKEQFESYTKSYEAYKGNRSLLWWPTNGKVTLDVELGRKTTEFTVPPIQATILWHFERNSQWSLQDLSTQMKVTPGLLRKKIAFWQGKGLIREISADQFKLMDESEDGPGMESSTDVIPVAIEDDEEGDNLIESANDQREEALQVFWSYIVGMLTNLESLPLERIHQMLRMFASHGVEFSQQELRGFLQKKVQAQKLVYVAGVYQLPK